MFRHYLKAFELGKKKCTKLIIKTIIVRKMECQGSRSIGLKRTNAVFFRASEALWGHIGIVGFGP